MSREKQKSRLASNKSNNKNQQQHLHLPAHFNSKFESHQQVGLKGEPPRQYYSEQLVGSGNKPNYQHFERELKQRNAQVLSKYGGHKQYNHYDNKYNFF